MATQLQDLALDEVVDLVLADLDIETLTVTEVSDALQLPETAASCMSCCCAGGCCCCSIAVALGQAD